MKAVKIIFIGILLLLAGVFIVGFFLPKTAHVERSITIDSSKEKIFPYLNSMKQFQLWSPWAKLDPNAENTYFGPDAGIGSGMHWDSEDKRVGKGTQVIVESAPLESVTTQLDFGDKSTGFAQLSLNSADDEVVVTWQFDMDFGMNPIMRYMGLMMDSMVGKSYEQGLRSLKELVESLPKVVTEVVNYDASGTELSGFLAYPESVENAPGVLVVHEWWGHNEYARKRAEMLAELGYVAFALDMYGKGKVTGHPKEANAFMMEVINGDGVAVERFMAAYDLLKNHDKVNGDKLAAIGYCFGGAVVLSMARAGVDLEGVVSFHGSLGGLAPISEAMSSKVMVFNGADDPFITGEQVSAFKAEMDAANADYEFIEYPDAKHGFTNPAATAKGQEYSLPLEYNAEADQDSWQKMKDFFQQIF